MEGYLLPYRIHVLLGGSHFPSGAYKSECENSTLALLQRFKGNYVSCAVLEMMLFTSVSEK